MRILILTLAVTAVLWTLSGARAEEADAELRAKWRKAFDAVAGGYELAHESGKQKLTLVEKPTYIWARSGPHGGTYGAVYVWTCRGNAESVACFWRYPGADGKATIVNELHSLSPEILISSGKDSDSWKPKTGLKRVLLPDAPTSAKTASGRLQQMRGFCRDFTAKSVSVQNERTELRLLPQPLYRNQSDDPAVLDGGLFAFVCSIGTDPEVFLLLEARDTADGPQWHYALARFSHMDLFVNYKDREVWQALGDRDNPISHNADRTYWVFGMPLEE
jgi:hypothetical protein